MNQLTEQQARELHAIDSRHLDFPTLGPQLVATSWHYWLALDELKSVYGWGEAELLALVAEEHRLTGRDLVVCFETVVAYAYAECRQELSEVCEAPTWLPLLPKRVVDNAPTQAA